MDKLNEKRNRYIVYVREDLAKLKYLSLLFNVGYENYRLQIQIISACC